MTEISEDDWVAHHAAKNSAGCFDLAVTSLRERLEKSKVVIGDAVLYNEDCRFILPTLHNVDAVVTDPPYESQMHAAKRGEKAFGATRRIRLDGHANPPPVDFASIDGMREDVAPAIVKISAGWSLIFCTPEGVAPWRDALEAAGAKYKRACVWVKPDSAPQFNGQGPAMGAEMFVAAWCGKGHSKWNGGGRRNVFTHLCQPSNRTGLHPTEKPISLMMELVKLFTDYGDTVLDPFMGIASTGVACVKLGRKFIGIERERKYFDIACRRIEEAYKQGDLFVKAPAATPYQTTFL